MKRTIIHLIRHGECVSHSRAGFWPVESIMAYAEKRGQLLSASYYSRRGESLKEPVNFFPVVSGYPRPGQLTL